MAKSSAKGDGNGMLNMKVSMSSGTSTATCQRSIRNALASKANFLQYAWMASSPPSRERNDNAADMEMKAV
eukprot:CAMPEP_0198129434 /NCGR_PEP_ID=MMETSP1442-20131203/51707_1 /TAXON_ID= /ORGANISM="Craspedostauros australis, Strain CCMP3328" /LENGTH=70 /DNA_ID=CAMNT_0043789821 /DNA_START=309 /DNA_END=521 /DNA_ORIENTATION=+